MGDYLANFRIVAPTAYVLRGTWLRHQEVSLTYASSGSEHRRRRTGEALKSLAAALDALALGTGDARTLLAGLRHAGIELTPDAFRDLCQRWSANTGVRTEVVLDADTLDADTAYELAWILHEALRNVAAHASARHATVMLRAQTDIELHVADDGAGFAVPEPLESLAGNGRRGLVRMAERARALGGSLEVRSSPGAGTRIIARVPSYASMAEVTPSGRGRAPVVALSAVAVVLMAVAAVVWWPHSGKPTAAEVRFETTPSPVATSPAAIASPSPSGSPPTPRASSSTASVAPVSTRTAGTPTSKSTAPCTVGYVVHGEAGGKFTADLRITNGRSSALTGWVLRFRFSDGQKVTGSSAGITTTQHGPKVAISGSATLPAHDTIAVSIQGSASGPNEPPSSFTLNEVTCETPA
jgi:two-component sensor histidine kinase